MDVLAHTAALPATVGPGDQDDVGTRLPADALPVPEMFQGLGEAALQELMAQLQPVHLTSGETLLRQGEPGDCMYVLVNGRLRAYIAGPDGSEVAVGEVGRGEVVGEMVLLVDEPRVATVRAIRDCELLRLSKTVFDRFIEKYPTALEQIARVNIMRLRRSLVSPRIESPVTTIAIVSAGREAPLSTFASGLARALAAVGPTLHLTRQQFDRYLADAPGATAPTRVSVSAWLNEQESKYRFVVYECENAASRWTRRCLRQADHVLAVGAAGGDPALGEAEAAMHSADRRGVPRSDLVLVHPRDASRPGGTRAWLAVRQVDAHHHVRADCDADFDRLARYLTGRAIGLVLSGGGARGLAHIGALRAIEELGIPIDLVGGTSCGALIAAAFAIGLDSRGILQEAKDRLIRGGSLLDFTLPFVSLVSGRRVTREIQKTFGDWTIEDLWLNYFCVSTNLSRGRMIVHRNGSLWRALRASVSLPGILPPVVDGTDLLVDGSLMNKLPVDVMRGLCNRGQVLAVSVSISGELRVDQPFGAHLSGWEVLRRRLNPFRSRRKEPNIASILLCSSLVKSTHTLEALEREADFCVRVPPVPIGLFDFRAVEALVEAGYRAAIAQLQGWSSNRSPRSGGTVPITGHAAAAGVREAAAQV